MHDVVAVVAAVVVGNVTTETEHVAVLTITQD